MTSNRARIAVNSTPAEFEGADDVSPDDSFQGRVCRARGRGFRLGERIECKYRLRTQDNGPLHQILELAHVARPGVLLAAAY